MKYLFSIFVIITSIAITSCTSEKNPLVLPEISDSDLYSLSSDTSKANIRYKSGAILPPNPGSPHGRFKIRMNSTTASILDASQRHTIGTVFPEGSLLIKETYNASDQLELYLTMYKSEEDKNSNKGWVWGEYNASGSKVIVGAASKGSSCITCHSGGEGLKRDYTRLFEF